MKIFWLALFGVLLGYKSITASDNAIEKQKLEKTSFPCLIDMGKAPILKAYDFIESSKEQDYQDGIHFVSLHGKQESFSEEIKNAIETGENYNICQYIFVASEDCAHCSVCIVKNLKKQLKWTLENQMKLIMFCPSELTKLEDLSADYDSLIGKKNTLSFNFQYSMFSGQVYRSICPLGISIDIPSDKHTKGYWSNPFSCTGRSYPLSRLCFSSEALREISVNFLHRWKFRNQGVENGTFADENHVLKSIGIFSGQSIGTRFMAFIGGY